MPGATSRPTRTWRLPMTPSTGAAPRCCRDRFGRGRARRVLAPGQQRQLRAEWRARRRVAAALPPSPTPPIHRPPLSSGSVAFVERAWLTALVRSSSRRRSEALVARVISARVRTFLSFGLPDQSVLKLDFRIDIGQASLLGFDIGRCLRERGPVIRVVDPEQDVARTYSLIVFNFDGRDVARHLWRERGYVSADIRIVGRRLVVGIEPEPIRRPRPRWRRGTAASRWLFPCALEEVA